MAAVVFRIKLSQLPQRFAKLGPRMREAALRGAKRGAYRAVSTLQTAASAAGAFNTGHYKRAWKAESLPDGARVANDAPYAGVIEYGRRPGSRMPPLQPIQDWIQRKMGKSRAEAKRLAFPIARAIAKRGLKERRVLRNSLPDISDAFMEEVMKELNAEMLKP